jgi:OFA family oxalate/formate antiporter-like MFS transporter
MATVRGSARGGGRALNVNNRWFQLGASLIAMIMIANLQYSWTLFVKPLQLGTGWKLSDIQAAATLFILFQTWAQPCQGWLIDRMGPRLFISLAGVLCGIGWGGLGFASSLPILYTLYVVAGIGAALVYGGSIGSALKWFTTRRGLASGIMAAGFGGGAGLFIPFIASMLRTSGYRSTFLWTGIFQGVIILIVAQFLRHPRAEPAAPAPAKTAGVATLLGQHHFTTGEMLRTPQFWLMYAAFVMMATGGLLLTLNAGPIAGSWGIAATALALATSLNAVANGGSRIFWGWVSDRTGRVSAMVVAFLLQAGCLLLVTTVGRVSGTWFAVTLVLTFFTWGEIYSLFPALLGDYYGTRHATSNYGVLYSAKGVASILGGWVAALIYESSGSWSAVLYGSAAMALVAAALILGLRALSSAPSRAPLGMPATAK